MHRRSIADGLPHWPAERTMPQALQRIARLEQRPTPEMLDAVQAELDAVLLSPAAAAASAAPPPPTRRRRRYSCTPSHKERGERH
jgi:hypothetical protein